MNSRRSAASLVLSAAVLWGFIGISVRPLGGFGLTTADLTFVRSAAVFLSALVMISASDVKYLHIRLSDLWIFLGSGVLSIAFFNACYFMTQQIMTLSLSSVFLYTAPFFVIILSAAIFREPITKVKLFALAAAFVGCVLSSGALSAGSGLSAKGAAAGLCSGFGYGLYSIFGRLAMKRYSSLTYMLYTFFIAAAVTLPFADVRRIAEVGAQGGGIYLLMFAFIFTVMPYMLYTMGLKKMSAGSASVLAYAEPMTATAVGLVFFGEKPDLAAVIGIAMIFFAVVVLYYRSEEREKIKDG